MQEIDWGNFSSGSKGNGDGISFLRFERDKATRIRPFGGAVGFYKIFIEKGKPSIVVDAKVKDQACKMLSEHSGKEFNPSWRCAMFVIDREDGRIKVMEGGNQIFEAFSNWSKGSGIKPGTGQAGDWQISVTGDGVGGANPRKYSPVYLGPSLFSDDEKTMITELKNADKLQLSNFLKEVPLDKVLEVAYGVTDSSPEPQEQKQAVGAGASDLDW